MFILFQSFLNIGYTQLLSAVATFGLDVTRILGNLLEDVDETTNVIEYTGITDGLRKFIGLPNLQKDDIKITQVQRIRNDILKTKWNRVRREMFQPDNTETMFHGTSTESIVAIIREGFKLPSKSGMFGKGVYFACDESKSAQYSLQHGSYMLLACNVRIGRSLELESGCNTMTLAKLQQNGCDSVFAPGGTKNTGGVRRGEYVIYRPEQALPTHLVHFELK